MEDKKHMDIIRRILARGNDAQVRKDKDGNIRIYEVKLQNMKVAKAQQNEVILQSGVR